MRIRLTKQFTFEMAHALPDYDGLCRHIHGHTFHLEVCISGKPLQHLGHPKNGMVMDFKVLKKLVQEAFVGKFDHALVLPDTTPQDVVDMLQHQFGRVITLSFQPTCENLISICVQNLLPEMPAGVELCRIKLAETTSSYAEWYAADQ